MDATATPATRGRCRVPAAAAVASPWAAEIYARARARNKRHPHAVRILARAWIRVIWRCWQDGTTYDPTKHGGQRKLAMATAA